MTSAYLSLQLGHDFCWSDGVVGWTGYTVCGGKHGLCIHDCIPNVLVLVKSAVGYLGLITHKLLVHLSNRSGSWSDDDWLSMTSLSRTKDTCIVGRWATKRNLTARLICFWYRDAWRRLSNVSLRNTHLMTVNNAAMTTPTYPNMDWGLKKQNNWPNLCLSFIQLIVRPVRPPIWRWLLKG